MGGLRFGEYGEYGNDQDWPVIVEEDWKMATVPTYCAYCENQFRVGDGFMPVQRRDDADIWLVHWDCLVALAGPPEHT
jgi:hypothetical protein